MSQWSPACEPFCRLGIGDEVMSVRTAASRARLNVKMTSLEDAGPALFVAVDY